MNESNGTIWQVPQLNIESMLEYIQTSEDEMINELVVDQYENLMNLGIDYIKDNNIKDEILHKLIIYTNDNYLPIINIDMVLDTPHYVQIIGRYIYNFICIDLIKQILPNVMNELGIKNPPELATLDEDILKEKMLRVINQKIELLKRLNLGVNNRKTYMELLKWVFYIDLVDNNVSNFIENYLVPVCVRYSLDIISKT